MMSNKGIVSEIMHKMAERQLTGKPHTGFKPDHHAVQTCSKEAFVESHNSHPYRLGQ